MLAIHTSSPASRVVKVISVSRVFKSMQTRGLVTMALDPADGHVRVATITPAGQSLHDRILQIAMIGIAPRCPVLNSEERKVLLSLLRRSHDTLPAVDAATATYLALHFPNVARLRKKSVSEGCQTS